MLALQSKSEGWAILFQSPGHRLGSWIRKMGRDSSYWPHSLLKVSQEIMKAAPAPTSFTVAPHWRGHQGAEVGRGKAETQRERQRQFHECLLIRIQCFLCPTQNLPICALELEPFLWGQKLDIDEGRSWLFSFWDRKTYFSSLLGRTEKLCNENSRAGNRLFPIWEKEWKKGLLKVN